jgi:hypothetical protein
VVLRVIHSVDHSWTIAHIHPLFFIFHLFFAFSLGIKDGPSLIHTHYFHPKSGGFPENAVKTIRKSHPECRKRKRNQEKRPHRKFPPGYFSTTKELTPQELETIEFKVMVKVI